MAKKSRKRFGLAFDSGLKLICDAPRKKSPIHLCHELATLRVRVGRSSILKKKSPRKNKSVLIRESQQTDRRSQGLESDIVTQTERQSDQLGYGIDAAFTK